MSIVASRADAHLHIPKTSANAVSVLLKDMDKASIEKAVLIVNTEPEMISVRNDLRVFLENRNRFHLVAGLNMKKPEPLSIYSFFREVGIHPDVKLHPKMFGYTMADLPRITEALSGIECRNIVIDSLCFGEQLANHIGIEMAIDLAREFPEKKVVIAHSGFIKLLECQMFTRDLANIFYDLSFTASYINHTSVRLDMVNFIRHTSGRVMFGSDYPDFSFDRAVESFMDLCAEAGLSEEALADVFFRNAIKIYWGQEQITGKEVDDGGR